MPRAHSQYIPGHLWHITHRCHKKERIEDKSPSQQNQLSNLIMEVEMENTLHEVVIQIEHMSKREDVSMRIYEYLCYAWRLKKRSLWSIVICTDDNLW